MASDVLNNSTTYIELANSTNWMAQMRGACDYIASRFGLLLHTAQDNEDGTTYLYYKYGSSNMGLIFKVPAEVNTVVGTIGVETFGIDPDGNIYWNGSTMNSIRVPGIGSSIANAIESENKDPIRLYSATETIGGLSRKTVGMKGTNGLSFTPFNAIDYFSGKTLLGFVCHSAILLYDEDLKQAVNVYGVFDKLGYWPDMSKKNVNVAYPAMLCTNNFYGYINSPSCVYYLVGGTSVDGGVEINKTKFVPLVNGLYVRC